MIYPRPGCSSELYLNLLIASSAESYITTLHYLLSQATQSDFALLKVVLNNFMGNHKHLNEQYQHQVLLDQINASSPMCSKGETHSYLSQHLSGKEKWRITSSTVACLQPSPLIMNLNWSRGTRGASCCETELLHPAFLLPVMCLNFGNLYHLWRCSPFR